MSLLDTWLDQFRSEIAAVRRFRALFSIAVVVVGVVIGGGLYYVFNWQMWNVLEMKKILIAELTDENNRLKSSKDIKQRSDQEAQREKTDLKTIEGQTFSHEQVILDGFVYRNCTFDNVTFVFNGGPGGVDHCTIKAGQNGVLTFSKPVERTVKILHALGFLKPGIDPQTVLRSGSAPYGCIPHSFS